MIWFIPAIDIKLKYLLYLHRWVVSSQTAVVDPELIEGLVEGGVMFLKATGKMLWSCCDK